MGEKHSIDGHAATNHDSMDVRIEKDFSQTECLVDTWRWQCQEEIVSSSVIGWSTYTQQSTTLAKQTKQKRMLSGQQQNIAKEWTRSQSIDILIF